MKIHKTIRGVQSGFPLRFTASAVFASSLLCVHSAIASTGVVFSGVQSTVGTSSFWSGPVGVAADDSGNLYVASYLGGYISKVVLATGQTTRVSAFSVRYPQDMKIFGGNIYIASQGNNEIKVYSLATQQLVKTLYCPGVFALTIDAAGNVYAGLDAGSGSSIEVFPNGTNTPTVIKSSGLQSMTGLAITPSGQLYAADTSANTIYQIDTTNRYAISTVPIHVSAPRGLSFDSSNRLYVAAAGTPGQNDGMLIRYPANSYTDASAQILAQNLNYEEEVSIASTGDAYVTSFLGNAVIKISPNADFGTTVPVGSSATQTLSFTINAGTTIGSLRIGNDQNDIGAFSIVSTTCNPGYYNGNATCTATVSFAPSQAASTRAWIDVLDAANNALSTVYLSGTGLAPQLAFTPTSSQSQPLGVGAVYGIAPLPNQRAVVASATAIYAGSLNTAPTLLASGVTNPSELAIDGKQNLFIADTGNQRIATLPVFTDPTHPSVLNTSGQLATFSTSSANFTGVAVDGSGSVYYADATNNQIIRRDWTDTGYGPELVVASSLTNPGAIAVDGFRNVFVLSGANIVELPWMGQGYGSAIPISSQITSPSAISVDGAGNLYVSDSTSGRLVEIPFTGGSYGAQFTLISGAADARQALIEYYGTIYLLGGSSQTITVADRMNNVQLAFPATTLQTTSTAGPLPLTVQNIGTAPLTFTALPGSNPSLSSASFAFNAASNCPISTGSASTLAVGQVCSIAIDYTPQSQTSTGGTLSFTDDALNQGGSSQNVTLSGIVITAPTQVLLPTLRSQISSGGNLGVIAATIEDGNGNVATTSSAVISVTVTGPNGYSNTVSATAANGVANVDLTSLNLNRAGQYTIAASSPNLTTATATVTVVPGAAAQLNETGLPTSLSSGSNPGTITATVQDSNGNTVTASAAVVTATITGPNNYQQIITSAAVNGVATLNLSSLNLATSGTYTVTTSSNGITGTASTLVVSPGAAANISLGPVPTNLVSGQNPGIVTATVKDANGNVTPSSAAISVTVKGPNGYLKTVSATAANGVANVNLTSLNLNRAGQYTIATSSPNLATATAVVTVAPGAATQLISTGLPTSLSSGSNPGTITATIQDSNGNTVASSTAVVTSTITGPNNYSQVVTSAAVNGVATLNLSSLNLATSGTYTVSTSSNGITSTASTLVVNPGAAANVSLGPVPTNLVSGQNPGIISATVKDANGNVVTNSSAQITATVTGPNGYSQVITATAINGVLTLDLSSIKPTAAGAYTLTVSGTGLTPVTAAITVAAATQTINLPSLPNVTFGSGPTMLPATSSAGLPITYTVTGPAVISGNTLVVNGAGTVTITAKQTGDSAHSPVTAVQSFTVAQAASTVALSSNTGVVTSGATTVLTVQVTSTAGTPTGTITFLNGSTVIGQSAVNAAGTASLSVSNLPTGALNITASYSGDSNFVASSSSMVGVTVQDFAITSISGATSPIVPGTSASYSFSITPGASGFASAITLTASGLPAGATYSFSPATVTPGSAAANTVLTVQTAKPIVLSQTWSGVAGVTLALLLMPFGVSRRARSVFRDSRVLTIAGFVVLMTGVATLTGCGSSNGFFAQQQNSYTVSVTATSGSLVHTTNVVVNVQ